MSFCIFSKIPRTILCYLNHMNFHLLFNKPQSISFLTYFSFMTKLSLIYLYRKINEFFYFDIPVIHTGHHIHAAKIHNHHLVHLCHRHPLKCPLQQLNQIRKISQIHQSSTMLYPFTVTIQDLKYSFLSSTSIHLLQILFTPP